MRRRDFLKTSVAFAGSGLVAAGCQNAAATQPPAAAAPPTDAGQQAATPPATASSGTAFKGVEVVFHGLTLLVMPPDKSTKRVDVAFINTLVNTALPVHYHAPTLKIDKNAVHPASTALPAASDIDYSYYSLTGPIFFVPTDQPDPGARSRSMKDDLEWRDEPLTGKAPDCVSGKAWNNLAWVLDFNELNADARLPAGWRTDRTKFLAWTRLSNGHLENDNVPEDADDRSRYTVKGTERLLKDRLRYLMPASAPYLQIRFGEGQAARSLIVPCGKSAAGVAIDVFHLSTPGMNPMNGPLRDYYAMYEVLLTKTQLGALGSRETLSNRHQVCGAVVPSADLGQRNKTPKSGNCAALRITEV